MSGKGRCLVQAATLRGVEAVPVDVEVAVSSGVPGFAIVGMADASVQESRERVKAALRSCGFTMPASKIVVNLAPGALRKTGSGFDLPIAAGILVATGQVDPSALERALFVGELSLEGAVRPVAGLLAYALCARMLGVGKRGRVRLGGWSCAARARWRTSAPLLFPVLWGRRCRYEPSLPISAILQGTIWPSEPCK